MHEKSRNSSLSLIALLFFLASAFLVVYCTDHQKVTKDEFIPLSKQAEQLALYQVGERLFFDKRLSIDNTIACADCHIPALAFTDGDSVSTGVHGRMGFRNSPSLFNVVNQDKFMWDGGVKTLELQALVPLQDTNEMGSMVSDLVPELSQITYYDSMSRVITGDSFSPYILTRALGEFQKGLYREDSRYDRWRRGEIEFSEREKAGFQLFTEKLHCASCHTPPTFTNNAIESNGLYEEYSQDPGRYRITGDTADIGKFKVPSLRNVEITAPYMHDGSFTTLSRVVDHYNSGGSDHINKSGLIVPLQLSSEEKEQLISFLKSLSDVSMKNHWQKVFNTQY